MATFEQLAKTLFLTPHKTLLRKIKEAFLAFQLERRYTKNEILELYLNQIYFGSGAYGVESAARIFFGKQAKDLDQKPMVSLNSSCRYYRSRGSVVAWPYMPAYYNRNGIAFTGRRYCLFRYFYITLARKHFVLPGTTMDLRRLLHGVWSCRCS